MPGPIRVRVDSRVIRERAPVVYVAHAEDDTWFLGANGFTDRPLSAFTNVRIGTVLAADPTCRGGLHLPRGWHAWREDASDEWKRHRIPKGRMHLLTYEARSTSEDGVGAFVNAWVKRPSLDGARRAARSEIRRAGYRIVSVDLEQEISLRACAAAGRTYFRQAGIDGEAFVFNRFPLEA